MRIRFFILFVLTVAAATLILQNSTPLVAKEQPAAQNAMVPAAAITPAPSVAGPFIGAPIPATRFNGDVRNLPKAPVRPREAPLPLRRPVSNVPARAPAAPSTAVLQTQMGTHQSSAPLQNFDGISSTGWYPPDPNGDVGLDHYVQAVNDSIGVYDKTGPLLASSTFDALFSGVGGTGNPCGNGSNAGDPVVLYDPIADRWFIADMGYAVDGSPPYYECVGMSQTSDPTQGWNLYALPITDPPGTNDINGDYAKFGIWADGIYISANIFDSNGNYQGARVWALDRSDMMSGASMRHAYFDVSSSYGNLLPSNLRGSTMPPTGEPAFFASVDQPNTFHLWKFHIDWNTLTNSTFTGPTDLTVASFVMACDAANTITCVPELNGDSVDALGDRLMMQLQYRNIGGTESLWANHTVAASANTGYPTGIRWYEIRDPNGTPAVFQQGTYQPDSNYRWMGSLAVDKYGDMALGYSVSSSSMYPAIRYAGRMSTDPVGKLCIGETALIEGTGSQTGNGNRWGDYTAMTIDPADDLTFWYTNEYYSTTGGDWRTRIGSFQLNQSTAPTLGPYVYYLPLVARSEYANCY